MPRCNYCRGPLRILGVLGELIHYRCRDCGLMFTRRSQKKPWWS